MTSFRHRLIACTAMIITAGSCRAQDSTLRRAMRDELQRNVRQLRLDTVLGPYFISYRSDDVKSMSFKAADGALTDTQYTHSHNITVRCASARRDSIIPWGIGAATKRSGLAR